MIKKAGGILPVAGLDVSKPGKYIEAMYTPDCQNMLINRMILQKRNGTSEIGTTQGEEIMAGREFTRTGVRYLVRIGLNEIREYNDGTSKWIDKTTLFTVTANNKYIEFNIGGAQLTATVTEGTYPMGASETEAGSLLKAVYDAIHAAEAAGTYTLVITSEKVVITRSAGTLQLLWKTGTVHGSDNDDKHIGTLLGYTDSADDTGAITYTADSQVTNPLTGTTSDPIDTAVTLFSGVRTLLITNNIDNIRKFDGTTQTANLGGTPPKCKYLIDYKTYIVLANVNDGTHYPLRVQWSGTGTPETWSGGNTGSNDLTEEGTAITGLNMLGNYLTVHKENCIYVGYLIPTSSIFQFDRKNTGAGTTCNATIQELPSGEQIFLAKDGLRLFNGISAPLIKSPISDELREGVNPEYVHKCWSIIVRELDEYWVGIPMGSQTTPDTVYKYNYITGSVHKDLRSNITAAWTYTQISQPVINDLTGTIDEQTGRYDDSTLLALFPIIMLGDNTGITCKSDSTVNNDNGVLINAYWTSKDFTSKEAGRFIRCLQQEIWAKGNTMTFEYSIDRGQTWTEITDSPITLNANWPDDDSPIIIYFDTHSTKIRFKFSNAVLGETFSLQAFILSYIDREMRS